jgi:hypothetical protein
MPNVWQNIDDGVNKKQLQVKKRRVRLYHDTLPVKKDFRHPFQMTLQELHGFQRLQCGGL